MAMMSTTKSFKNLAFSITVAGTAASLVLVGADSASALTFRLNANILSSELEPSPTPVGTITGTFKYEGGVFSNIKLTADRPLLNTLFGPLNLDREYGGVASNRPNSGLEAWFTTSSAETPLIVSLLKLRFSSDLGNATIGQTIALAGANEFNSVELLQFPFIGVQTSSLEGSVTAIPTPALLPGLIGMGVAALRKRQDDSEDSAEA
jgi:hypothetical protein